MSKSNHANMVNILPTKCARNVPSNTLFYKKMGSHESQPNYYAVCLRSFSTQRLKVGDTSYYVPQPKSGE